MDDSQVFELVENEGVVDSSTIMFCDIKDFTLKTSLLTSKQIDKILSTYEKMVSSIVEKNKGKIVKAMGDAYMVVFLQREDSLRCAIQIQQAALDFSKDKHLNLHKIEVRISINQGEIVKKKTLIGDDYFGEAVNMSHRLESITPENKIFITSGFYEHIKDNTEFHCFHLGKTTFKGILYEVDIYEVLYLESDIAAQKQGLLARPDINIGHNSEYANKVKEADELIFTCASVGALLGIQPIPFLDTFNLVPIHIYMLIRIAYIYGKHISVDEAITLSKSMATGIGLSYLALQGAIGASKIILPFVAGYVTVPLNFSITYALGKVFSCYHYHAIYGVAFSNKDIKELFNDKRNVANDLGKKQKNEILKKAKESKDIVLSSDIVQEVVKKLSLEKTAKTSSVNQDGKK